MPSILRPGLLLLVAGVLLGLGAFAYLGFIRGEMDGFAATNGAVVFDEEFDGSDIDTSAWTVLRRGPDETNNEAQCYLPANASVKDGMLSMVTKRDDTGCSGISGTKYSAAMLQWKTYSFTYGRVDVRARMPDGSGIWPAIWLLGAKCQASNPTDANDPSCDWPNPGSDEIDIAEYLGGDFNHVNQQIHTAGSDKGCKPSITDSDGWHVYSIDWQPGKLTFYVDGKQTCRIADKVPTTPMFLILNTAVGGAGGTINDEGLPATHVIDYVRVTEAS